MSKTGPVEILRVAHLIAPIAFGGGESLLSNLLSETRDGLEETVISITMSEAFNKKLDSLNIRHFELRNRSLGHGISKTAMALEMPWVAAQLPRLLGILSREKIGIIHAHGFPAVVLGAVACKLAGVKGIYTHHFHRAKPSDLERALLGSCYKAYARCTGVSDLVTDTMRAAFPQVANRFVTIHNCVGREFFTPTHRARTDERRSAKTVFIQVARFAPFKNQMLVIEALSRLPHYERNLIEVIFVGDGPKRPEVMSRASKLGLRDNVKFLGFVPYDKLPSLMSEADFGLFPSENEGFGIGAVECMAAGLPVLTLDNELMREIVGAAGVRCEPNQLHKGFLELRRSGKSLRSAAQERATLYMPERIKDKYCAQYEALR